MSFLLYCMACSLQRKKNDHDNGDVNDFDADDEKIYDSGGGRNIPFSMHA